MTELHGKIVNVKEFDNGTVSITLKRKEYYTQEKGNVYGFPKFLVLNKKIAQNVLKHYPKGTFAAIDYNLSAIPYEKDGALVYPENQLIVQKISYLPGSKPSDDNTDNDSDNLNTSNENETNPNATYQRLDDDPFAQKGPIEVSEDDLPF